MGRGSRLTRLDAFTKTVEDARVRTTSGGIVTLVSLCVVFILVIGEFREYRRIQILPELVVDKARGEVSPFIHYIVPPRSLINSDSNSP